MHYTLTAPFATKVGHTYNFCDVRKCAQRGIKTIWVAENVYLHLRTQVKVSVGINHFLVLEGLLKCEMQTKVSGISIAGARGT